MQRGKLADRGSRLGNPGRACREGLVGMGHSDLGIPTGYRGLRLGIFDSSGRGTIVNPSMVKEDSIGSVCNNCGFHHLIQRCRQ